MRVQHAKLHHQQILRDKQHIARDEHADEHRLMDPLAEAREFHPDKANAVAAASRAPASADVNDK